MSEEYISKSMLEEKLNRIKPMIGSDNSFNRAKYMQYLSTVEAIRELPTVSGTIPIKTAKWLAPDARFDKKIWGKCSNCGKHREIYHKHIYLGEPLYFKEEFSYCPNCGAKLEE